MAYGAENNHGPVNFQARIPREYTPTAPLEIGNATKDPAKGSVEPTMSTTDADDIAPLAEMVCGAKKNRMAMLWANGDVTVSPWDNARLGVALAGYRFVGGELRPAIGRLNDPKCEAEILAWCRKAMAGSGR